MQISNTQPPPPRLFWTQIHLMRTIFPLHNKLSRKLVTRNKYRTHLHFSRRSSFWRSHKREGQVHGREKARCAIRKGITIPRSCHFAKLLVQANGDQIETSYPLDFHERSKCRHISQNVHPDTWNNGLSVDRSAPKAFALLPFVLLFLVEDLTLRCHPAHFDPWCHILQPGMYLPEDKDRPCKESYITTGGQDMFWFVFLHNKPVFCSLQQLMLNLGPQPPLDQLYSQSGKFLDHVFKQICDF